MASAISLLKCESPWIGSVNNQPAEMCGIGVLDKYMRIHISALESVRKSTCFFTAVITAATGVVGTPAATGDIFIATQAPQLFVNGVGTIGTAEGAWWSLTREETNLDPNTGDPGGSRDIAFFSAGMSVSVGTPFQRNAVSGTPAAAAVTDIKYENAFLRPDAPYQAQLKQAVLEAVTIGVSFGNTGTTQQLGGAENYPSPAGGISGGQTTRNGSLNRAFDWTPFPIALMISSDNFIQKALFTATFNTGRTVANVAATPTSITNAGAVALTSSTIFIPYWVQLFGHMVCYPYAMICGMPSYDASLGADVLVGNPQGVQGPVGSVALAVPSAYPRR